jgi:hypothetical protein
MIEDYNNISQEEFGLDFYQLAPNEREWVRDECYIDFDQYTVKEIKNMISLEITSNKSIIDFYGNEWWDYETE